MKINKYNSLVFAMLFGFGLTGHAQTKQWTLEECVRYALDNNITIKLSELDVKTADIDKRGALGSYLPTVNGNASHSWNIGLNVNGYQYCNYANNSIFFIGSKCKCGYLQRSAKSKCL